MFPPLLGIINGLSFIKGRFCHQEANFIYWQVLPPRSNGVFGRAPLQLSQLSSTNSLPNTSSSRNSRFGNSRKKTWSWESIFFMEFLKGYSKNTSYRHPHGVGVKLPTITTRYTRYPFARKNEDRQACAAAICRACYKKLIHRLKETSVNSAHY